MSSTAATLAPEEPGKSATFGYPGRHGGSPYFAGHL